MIGTRYVPFAYGFRPFFLAAGLFAVLGMGAWAWILVTGRAPFGELPPTSGTATRCCSDSSAPPSPASC